MPAPIPEPINDPGRNSLYPVEQSKLKEAILKFNGRYSKDRTVFLFDAAGKSMQLLIFEDDEIAIEKITCDRIRTGDIIAWKSYESEIEEPLLHRVICRKKTEGGYRFLTKGDWRIWHDRHWITPDEILGRVKSVRRGGHLLVIDTRIGGIISLTVGLISLICVMIKEPFNALYSKMRGIYNAAFPWHRKYRGGIFLNGYNGFPETEDWMKAVEEFEQQRPINEKGNIKIADANPGCGYSEEALRLMRKGFDVTNADLLRTDPSFDSAFDYVLIVRYINLLPARMRHKTYRRAFDLLKQGGKRNCRFKLQGSERACKKRFRLYYRGKTGLKMKPRDTDFK